MLNENMNESVLSDAICKYSLYLDPEKLIEVVTNNNVETGEYIKLLIAKTLADNTSMRIILADYYDKGTVLKENKKKAIYLYETAYKDGDIIACFKLGWLNYLLRNHMKAIEYFSECIRHDDIFSDEALGDCYANIGDSYDKIASPNIPKAKEFLEIAAEKYGNAYSEYRLGKIYSHKGSENYDPNKSVKYFQLANEHGNVNGAVLLAEKYAFGDEEVGIKKDRTQAIEILEKYKNSDEIGVFELLGRIYLYNGYDNEDPDYLKANEAFQKVLEIDSNYYKAGYIEQFLGLSWFMLDEHNEAIKCFKIADENGYYQYSALLGNLCKARNDCASREEIENYYNNAYQAGTINLFQCAEYVNFLSNSDYKVCNYEKAYQIAEYGVTEFNDVVFYLTKAKLVLGGKVSNKLSKREAAEIMEKMKSYDSLDGDDYELLANYYMEEKDYRLAEINYCKAFDLNNDKAGLRLARLYENGAGSINPDIQTAVIWYRKAADAGNKEAKKELECFTEKIFGGYKRVRSR